MAKIIARRTKFGFQATLLSISMLSDGAYAASDGEGTIRECYISNKLRKNTSNLKGASVQFNVNNFTMSPPAVEKKRASTATTAACSPRPAIANNTWYPAPLAASSHVAVGIFFLSGKGEKLAPTPTRGT